MSDHVIIVGVKRGKEYVPSTEINQMAGRIGRNQDGLVYSADILLHDEDFKMENELMKKESHNVSSSFNEIQKFSFHVLPEIVKGIVRDKDSMQEFYDRSFASFQEKKLDIEKVLEYLDKNEAIVRCVNSYENTFSPFTTGVFASGLYMHCGDVKRLKDNFERVISCDKDSDGAIAWALGNLETIRIHGDFGDRREEMERFSDDLPSDYECEEGCFVTSALWWCMLGNGSGGKNMANNVKQLKKHWGRINIVLSCLRINSEFHRELNLRITRNLPKELVPFFDDVTMSKGKARYLLDQGYNNSIEAANHKWESECN